MDVDLRRSTIMAALSSRDSTADLRDMEEGAFELADRISTHGSRPEAQSQGRALEERVQTSSQEVSVPSQREGYTAVSDYVTEPDSHTTFAKRNTRALERGD